MSYKSKIYLFFCILYFQKNLQTILQLPCLSLLPDPSVYQL